MLRSPSYDECIYINNLDFFDSFLQEFNDDGQLVNDAAIRQWNRKDVLARNCIMATTSKDMKENLYTCTTSAQMWTKLNQQYRLQTEEHLHVLWQDYYDYCYTEGTLITETEKLIY